MRVRIVTATVLGVVLLPGVALACGGLVAPNGAVNLNRTTTLAAYHDGVEHYVTAFEFSGLGGAKFGSIVPLPGEPSDVNRAGRWTLQRLVREFAPQPTVAVTLAAGAGSAPDSVEIIVEKRIDALDITVVKGGADEVAAWATQNGFALSADAPGVLDFYANRSPYFMAVRFDAKEARRRGIAAGDSTPIHLAIPIERPWVPLRILALGKGELAPVEADVFLMTDEAPAILPAPRGSGDQAGLLVAKGLTLLRSERASRLLTDDLRSDRNMDWMPAKRMWVTYLGLFARAGDLGYDLAIAPDGSQPSLRDAGLPRGLLAPERNPVRGPVIQIVPTPVPVGAADSAPAPVPGRSGWLAASAAAVALAVGMGIRRRLPA
ncbi:MAG TPA: DUF2330 domain-containing protein [Actinomycetota bacterium]